MNVQYNAPVLLPCLPLSPPWAGICRVRVGWGSGERPVRPQLAVGDRRQTLAYNIGASSPALWFLKLFKVASTSRASVWLPYSDLRSVPLCCE